MVEPDDDGRSARKRRAIMTAATTAFLDHGYRGTSMDEIAAAAQVSKQTVYKHFADKRRLFTAIVTERVTAASGPVQIEVQRLGQAGDLAGDLRALARHQLTSAMQSPVLRLRRLIIAEAGRFPELGRDFYEHGQQRTISALAESFAGLAGRGLLRVDDPYVAATHFNWLIMAGPMNAAMLLGRDEPPPSPEIDRWVAGGVSAFLAAYGAS